MAPAILAQGKAESKKSSSKQNMKKMNVNPDSPAAGVRVPLDIVALKAKLATENVFISKLLTNIPTQATHSVSEDTSVTSKKKNDSKPNKNDTLENRASGPDELKIRLAAKLSQLKGKRLDYSEKKMKTKLQRKLERLEKNKQIKKKDKMKSKIAKLAQATKAAAAASSSTNTSPTSIKSETIEPTIQNRPPKPIFNNEGRMVFSKFDFGELTVPTVQEKKKTLDPKAALIKIKKLKEKVQYLQEKGEVEKAKAIEEKQVWEGAIQRAEGLKVKDSVELLTKSLKKKQHKKAQSKKKWAERVEAVENAKEDKQKKRKENIKKRRADKLAHKLKRAEKKRSRS